jgi:hypothetical protein
MCAGQGTSNETPGLSLRHGSRRPNRPSYGSRGGRIAVRPGAFPLLLLARRGSGDCRRGAAPSGALLPASSSGGRRNRAAPERNNGDQHERGDGGPDRPRSPELTSPCTVASGRVADGSRESGSRTVWGRQPQQSMRRSTQSPGTPLVRSTLSIPMWPLAGSGPATASAPSRGDQPGARVERHAVIVALVRHERFAQPLHGAGCVAVAHAHERGAHVLKAAHEIQRGG